MTTRRELIIALGIGAVAAPLAAFAQQRPAKIARIGLLGTASASGYAAQLEALRAGLRDLGYIEGKNIVIEYRWAEENYDRLPALAAELVGLKVDVLVTHGTAGTLAAKRATTTIPIVMAVVGDAVATGIVPSIARPGGNITGSSFFNPEISAKRLELLKDAFPRTKRAAVLMNPDNPANGPVFQAMAITAKSLKVELQKFEVRGPAEFDGIFAAMAKKRIDAVVINEDAMLIANARAVADHALKHRLPSIAFKEIVEAGGLLAYGVNLHDMWRRAAVFVDKVLKGAKPAELPIEQSVKFELVVNRKTAKALGLIIPNELLLRADQVIE